MKGVFGGVIPSWYVRLRYSDRILACLGAPRELVSSDV